MTKKIVVIGGGLAGCLLCHELAGEANVTLLEIGDRGSIRCPDIAYDRKALAGVPTFCHGAGGTTNLWHNGLIPVRREDVSDRAFRAVLLEARAVTDRVASALFFPHASFSRIYSEVLSEIGESAEILGASPEDLDCLLYPKRYQSLTVHPDVRAYFNVTGLEFGCKGRRVTEVRCSSAGETLELAADIVIVAAGALGSPGVLSNLLATAGLPVGQVGHGFIDHPMGFVGKVRFRPEAAAVVRRLSLLDKGGFVGRTALRLRSDCGRYTGAAFLRPALTMHNRLEIYKFKSLLGAASGARRWRNACSWKLFHPDILAEIPAHLLGISIPSNTFNILFIAEQRRGTSRVYQAGGQLRLDWSVSAQEIAAYRTLLTKLERQLASVAQEVNIQTAITENWLWSAAHHSGTLAMGDGIEAPVDRDLMLKGWANVFACDGSVLPEHSYANTGLTIGQLAFRLAERVLHDLDV